MTRLVDLLFKLPNGTIRSLKHIEQHATIFEIKGQLELIAGCPAEIIKLLGSQGDELVDNDIIKRLSGVYNNTLLRVELKRPYSTIYQRWAEEDNSPITTDVLDLINSDNERILFNLLFMASFLGKLEICQVILQEGDAIDEKTGLGNTALHAATSQDRVSVALYFRDNGANIHRMNIFGETPLDVALKCGAGTCERKLRLGQWEKRKSNLEQQKQLHNSSKSYNMENVDVMKYLSFTSKQDETSNETPSDLQEFNTTESIPQYKPYHYIRKHLKHEKHEKQENEDQPSRPVSKSVKSRENLTKNKFTEKHLAKKTAVSTKYQPEVSKRNVRLCRDPSSQYEKEHAQDKQCRKSNFKLTRPQYLQFIKSSTGVVEEDFFADIFPGLRKNRPKSKRSFDEQMKINEKLFKKVVKNSQVYSSSESNSDDELEKRLMNQRAFEKWKQKKKSQIIEEKKKIAITPSKPPENAKKQCLGPLIMIGSTAQEVTQDSEEQRNSYITAHKYYKSQERAKSAPVSRQYHLGPDTYEEWLDAKRYDTGTDRNEPNKRSVDLKKKISYESWLEEANKRLIESYRGKKREEREKKEFSEWIEEIKKDVDTFGYWKRNKEEQQKREREAQRRVESERARREREQKEKKQKMSHEIYRDWMLKKENLLLNIEAERLSKEREKLITAKLESKH